MLFTNINHLICILESLEKLHVKNSLQMFAFGLLIVGVDNLWTVVFGGVVVEGSGFAHTTPKHAAFDNLVEGLKQDIPVANIIEEGDHRRPHIKTVEPESEDAGFAVALGVEIFHFDLYLLFVCDGFESRVVVEEVSDEGEVELGVTANKRFWCQEFAAAEFVSFLKDLFSALEIVSCVEGRARTAVLAADLAKEDGIIFAIFDVI